MMKKEAINHIITYVILSVIFQIVFYRESPFFVQRFLGSFYWLFMLPGASVMLIWDNKLGFAERLIAGTGILFAIAGILAYYLPIMGIPFNVLFWILPLALIAAGIIAYSHRLTYGKET